MSSVSCGSTKVSQHQQPPVVGSAEYQDSVAASPKGLVAAVAVAAAVVVVAAAVASVEAKHLDHCPSSSSAV